MIGQATYGSGTLGALAKLPLLVAGLAESVESLERLLVLGDGTGLLGLVGRWEGEGVAGDASGEVVTGSVTSLGLAELAGEDDQAGLVVLQSLNVELLALLGPGLPAVVDDDADAEGLLLADTSLLDLRDGESTTGTDLGVVPDGGAADSRAEELKRAGSEVEGLLLAVHPPPVLAAGLVEPRLDAALRE